MKIFGALLMIPLLGLPAQEGVGTFGLVGNAGPMPEWVAEGAVPATTPLPHDLHASYGNLGVDGSLAVLQIRIFQNDLEDALTRFHGKEEVHLGVNPEVDALFLQYLTEKFVLEADGQTLTGRIIGSGDDELDREPVWWYQIRFDAPAPIRAARVTNTILFEVFNDQSNILRVVDFPEESRRAYYFTAGEESVQITFEG